ncbi:hypothetical protein PC129_g15710 [Phytophthora cactorum]|uniref:Uncharacterized protein n=1 Tax=Phytophthora cactorum TaxID=29920 RepID=A0A329SNE7_9STRA|nr:hypothetical protein Pcac1_g24718 [Phytophthora cactorum]KAG2824835.1 hypothetical protein PC112_g9946 [Phytophthora cactorum]KAG2826648.1 hypothetical protein PC111_g8888 [Phytophthora cactorum]KAG2857945.1 hypothetical protein PC113_g10239 [Phytophthora cactorum]KAG2907083.1 hypothetical protein PC114_g10927 [Phytophthora cactorum]
MASVADLLRDFESLLVHKHRFALSDVVICLQAITHDLQDVQRALTVESASAVPLDNKSPDVLTRISGHLEHLVALVPSFLGERELALLLSALHDFGQLPNTLGTHPKLQESMESLYCHSKALNAAVARDAAVISLLTTKRDHFAKFLDEAVQVLQNSHSRRLEQYQEAIEQFTAEFKLALEDEHLQRVKQLQFDIQTIETSMSTMLLPHFEICRTITTANAQVQSVGSTFSKAERGDIDTFVCTAAKLKNGDVAFRSVLEGATSFLGQLALFEQAASKDAFLVCSSALKLQFRESLDQELFLAYVEDWVSKRETLQLTESSSEYQAATRRVQDLKEAIGRAHELAQTSQEKLALDDPSRESLAQEVTRIFHDEGGMLTRVDLPGCA